MGCQSSAELGRNLTFSICTHDAETGNLMDADTAPTYRVYEDETATAILTGTMNVLDDTHTTGFYTEQIVCSTANGFEVGKSYTVYIEATVDGNTGGIAYAFTVTDPNAVADSVLVRDMAEVEALAPAHSLASAVLKSVSRVVASSDGTELVTYRTDGETEHMTQIITVAGDLDPISGLGAAEAA